MSKEKFNKAEVVVEEGLLQKNMKEVMVCGIAVVACIFACVELVKIMDKRSEKAD